jgi:uncharacterized hydrophobic protein (TIGR00271 family)
VTPSQYGRVRDVLERHDVDFVSLDAEGGMVLQFPLPTSAFGPVLSDLRDAGVDDDAYTVLTKAEFVETSTFESLRQRFSGAPRSLALPELHGKVEEMQWPYQLYYAGSLLSVVVAAAGLLVDQPALVIGAMVIAPQVSSAISAPVGVMVADWDLFLQSLRDQTLGLALAILGAAAFSAGLRWFALVPPNLAVASIELVGLRLSPGFVTTAGAFAAGVLSAFGFTTEQSMSLVGVMIAAALVPAAAVAGFGITWGYPTLVVGATLLLAVNLLAINLGVLLTLLVMGYYPDWYGVDRPSKLPVPREQRATVVAVVVVVLAATVGATYLTATDVAFSRDVNRTVEETLDRSQYEQVSVVAVRSETVVPGSGEKQTGVVVNVRTPAGQSYPDLPTTLERGIERRTGRPASVTVRYTSVGDPGASSAPEESLRGMPLDSVGSAADAPHTATAVASGSCIDHSYLCSPTNR